MWQLDWQLNDHHDANQLSDFLLELGASSVWADEPTDLEDDFSAQPQSLQFYPNQLPDWKGASLHAICQNEEEVNKLLLFLADSFPELLSPHIHQPDFSNQKIQGVPPVLEFNGLVVYTSIDSLRNSAAITKANNIIIPAGLAFGTGTHQTTAMILEWLSQHNMKNRRILDYGCGSGILAIAALRVGALDAVAVDHDAQAVEATTINARLNNMESRVSAVKPGLFDKHNHRNFDVIFANILLMPLIELATLFTNTANNTTRLLLTGILDSQKNNLIEAYKNDWEVENTQSSERWCLLVMKRK